MKSEKLLSYVAVVVATIAALASIDEARTNRQQQAASVWPYLQMWVGLNRVSEVGDGGPLFSFNVANHGVGPAIIEDIELTYKGEAMSGWLELIFKVADEEGLDRDEVAQSISQAIAEPGEVITTDIVKVPIQSNHELLASHLGRRSYRDNAISYKICYCSIYGDCWSLTFPESRPKEMESCRKQDIVS